MLEPMVPMISKIFDWLSSQGIPDGRYFDVTKIKAPVLAQFGDLDKHAVRGHDDPPMRHLMIIAPFGGGVQP